MNISQAAKYCGMKPQTLRYYEQIGLISPARRQDNGYRDYQKQDLKYLAFVHRARETGFSIEECRELLALYRDPARQSKQVHALVIEKAKRVSEQISRLKAMQKELMALARSCQDDNAPECSILNNLAETSTTIQESKDV